MERVAVGKAPARIAGMFDSIAGRYDFLNHLLSAGFDKRWRARAVKALGLRGGERVLDLCTGTADLALAAARTDAAPRVVGLDFSGEMLRMARRKIQAAKDTYPVRLVRADASSVPMASETIDAVTIAFGIRNVERPEVACVEIHRVLKRGGRLVILEFGVPRARVVRAIYLWYFTRLLPRIGRLVSRHPSAYSYLPASVGAFHSSDSFAALLARSGFTAVSAAPLTFGIVYLFVATRN
jgi:demethylmenaquinone methyltransferase/2-methoxy-6-polyprenyl-1,4-benzoquinol methylase